MTALMMFRPYCETLGVLALAALGVLMGWRAGKARSPVWQLAFLVDHYVTVLAVSDTSIEVGDPLEGVCRLGHEQFSEKWRKCGIVVQRTDNGPQRGPS